MVGIARRNKHVELPRLLKTIVKNVFSVVFIVSSATSHLPVVGDQAGTKDKGAIWKTDFTLGNYCGLDQFGSIFFNLLFNFFTK